MAKKDEDLRWEDVRNSGNKTATKKRLLVATSKAMWDLFVTRRLFEDMTKSLPLGVSHSVVEQPHRYIKDELFLGPIGFFTRRTSGGFLRPTHIEDREVLLRQEPKDYEWYAERYQFCTGDVMKLRKVLEA